MKKAFRPGNVDLPTNHNIYSVEALNVVDRISDPMMPDLDPSLLDFRPMDIDFGPKKDDPLNWTSQSLLDPLSSGPVYNPSEDRPDDDDMHIDLELDLGDDDAPSIEIGRKDKGPSRPVEDDLISDDDKFPAMGEDELTITRISSVVPDMNEEEGLEPPETNGMNLNEPNENSFQGEENITVLPAEEVSALNPRLPRDSQSPLSSLRSSVVRDFDATNLGEDEETLMHPLPKAKKRKILQADADTVISQAQIKSQQTDRSAILKPASLLTRDPVLLNLMTMQRNGDFVSNIMGEGRTKGWAPELRGILSIEVVRKSGQSKRKRDSGVADMDAEEVNAGMVNLPQLDIPQEEDSGIVDEGIVMDVDAAIRQPSEILDLPAEDGINLVVEDEPHHIPDHDAETHNHLASDEEIMSPGRGPFDDTVAPLPYPIEQGAVSMGTQHAVHLLRDRLSTSSKKGSPPQPEKSTILFHQILPEATTTKADATKMFFEVLVLATKDAVKVDQSSKVLGGPLRIRGKRGLWGAWAEKEAGGEIAELESSQAAAEVAAAS